MIATTAFLAKLLQQQQQQLVDGNHEQTGKPGHTL
jgi:hypothetical protein